MHHFRIEDPNEGLRTVLRALKAEGITAASRNGPVVRFPRPVCLEYTDPRRRILSSPIRDGNPFFHLVETMWMFGGLCNLEPLLTYNAGMAQYSDDGKNLRGTAYGYRWRSHVWGDQLLKAVDALRANPDDRRVVMSMWDPHDMGKVSKDHACNLQVIFGTRPNPQGSTPLLDMTVTNRSNDLIYGAMGSNMFHFSMLLEYVAHLAGLEVGSYYQISTNLHLYTENEVAARCWDRAEDIVADSISRISDRSLTDLGLTSSASVIASYVVNRDTKPEDDYLAQVVAPLVEGYHIFKMKSRTGVDLGVHQRVGVARTLSTACASEGLRLAADAWLFRKLPPMQKMPPLTGGSVIATAKDWTTNAKEISPTLYREPINE